MKRKISVIIGGTGQIGSHIVRTLQKEGYLTVCVSSRPLPNSEQNRETDYYVFDMTQPKSIKMCCATISEKYGVIDSLINVLGKNRRGSLYEITEEMWDDVIDTNLKSVFFICQTFKKILDPCNGSSIINFASTAGIRALPMSPHYVAAKAGVIALTEYFAQAFAPSINVNCVAPGIVLTENHKPAKYANYDDMIKRIPLHQMASIEDVVDAVLYLMKAKTVTGHTLVVDGGLIL
jgi:NAD(P)-dependent dehydrogenase (short-subunit alcohol dehydrogenase family)